MTADLTLDAFLLARIAEDEAAAVAYRDGDSWGDPYAGEGDGTDLDYEQRFNVARVLARCAADRLIVELHKIEPESYSCPCCRTDHGIVGWTCEGCDAGAVIRTGSGCPTLLALASGYADHPDYREEWKP